MSKRPRNYLKIAEANLRQVVRESKRLSEDYGVDATPADFYGIWLSANRALEALVGKPSEKKEAA
jgi:hypothetical protein